MYISLNEINNRIGKYIVLFIYMTVVYTKDTVSKNGIGFLY